MRAIAVIFHYSIPVLSHEVRDKLTLRSVFLWSFIVATVIYIVNGLVLALYFGDAANTQCNLNWRGYVGCAARDANGDLPVSTWARCVRAVVLIFPPLDVLSGFPLNAVTLGNNLLTAFTGIASPTLAQHEGWWDMVLPTAWRCGRRASNAAYASVDANSVTPRDSIGVARVLACLEAGKGVGLPPCVVAGGGGGGR